MPRQSKAKTAVAITKAAKKPTTAKKKATTVKKRPKIIEDLQTDLDGKSVYMLDYENTQVLPLDVFLGKREETVIYVFLTPACKDAFEKKYGEAAKNSDGLFEIYLDGSGKNFLDYGIAMYIGAIYAEYEPKSVAIVSNDNGYEVLQQLIENMSGHKIGVAKTRCVITVADAAVEDAIGIVIESNKYPIDKLTKNQFISILRDSAGYSEEAAKQTFENAKKEGRIVIDNKTIKFAS